MVFPSAAQEILDRQKIEILPNSFVGALIAREAMTEADADTTTQELPARAASIVQRKMRQSPQRTQASINRATERARARSVMTR